MRIVAVAISAAGYQAGLAGGRRSRSSVLCPGVCGGDRDDCGRRRPGSEQIRTSHEALIDLRARLAAP